MKREQRKPGREPMNKKQLASGLADLIRAPWAWEPFYVERVARAARKEINRLRRELTKEV